MFDFWVFDWKFGFWAKFWVCGLFLVNFRFFWVFMEFEILQKSSF